MNMLLWMLQALLALAFFAHGCLLLFPPASIVAQMIVAPALVSAVYRRRRNTGGGGTDATGSHAHSALARLRCGRWIDDRDDLCHCFSPDAW